MKPRFERFAAYREYPPDEMLARARRFRAELARRRGTPRRPPAPPGGRKNPAPCGAAGSAPSGANLQPWHFTVVADPALRRRLRAAAEAEEREFYGGRASPEWLEALAPLGTDAEKPFLETAPVLIAVFAQRWGLLPDGRRVKHYYVPESVGIACGFLLAALHEAGLATLTHTPSPMGFLNEICRRPAHEKPYLLLVAGYPVPDCAVPVQGGIKKPLGEIADWV